jgi:excisionase family DNA binding protein
MWILVQRLSLVLLTAISTDHVLTIFTTRGIKADSIYSTVDVAALLKIERNVVIRLIQKGDLKARKIKGKYKILGQNLKEFLSE